jgi:hypothetical protein
MDILVHSATLQQHAMVSTLITVEFVVSEVTAQLKINVFVRMDTLALIVLYLYALESMQVTL